MEVIPLRSKAEQSVDQLCGWLAGVDDVASLVIIVKHEDNTFEVAWSRQELQDLAFAGLRLQQEIRFLMDGQRELV